MGLVLPGANDPDEFWRLLNQDRNVFAEPETFDLSHWYSADPDAEDKTYARVAGFLRGFRPNPVLADELARGRWNGSGHDPAVLLRHCLLQARQGVRHADTDRCGCYLVIGSNRALEDAILAEAVRRNGGSPDTADRYYPHAAPPPRAAFPDRVVRDAFTGLLPADTDWLAPDTACSSSLYAIDLGVKSLLAGDCDIAFCGGGNTAARTGAALFAKNKGLSRTGQVRAFDAAADGVLFSEGAAVVALKRMDRALADGDEILGVLAGFGGATDGQGSLMAPDPIGQKLAISRARRVNRTDAATVDWIVGHGTGTPVGDLSELRTIADLAGPEGQLCSSNKSLVGHPAWAAGAVSVIHALLALRHETIPAQRYFDSLPPDVPADRITVPTSDTPWPRTTTGVRTVGVSAFGFGGTNAHLLLRDHLPSESLPAAGHLRDDAEGEMALVGWSVHLPGTPDRDQVRRWLCTGDGAPPRSFGETYPLPPIRELRMPPVAARTVDRTHLMAIAAATGLIAEHGALWDEYRETTGVITAHMGPNRALIEYTIRTGADELTAAVADDPAVIRSLERELTALRTRLPAANVDSMPSITPNAISGLLANRLRLNGIGMALDSGRASTQAALHVAGRYLDSGELDIALVLAVNGNTTPTMAAITGLPRHRLAEGAVLLALTRPALAAEHDWPVLARIRASAASHADPGDQAPHVGWGEDDEPTYLAADGALALLRGLLTAEAEVELANPDPGPRVRFRPATVPRKAPQAPVPERTDRSTIVLRRRNAIPLAGPAGASVPAVPHGAVLLVESKQLAVVLADTARRAGATLLCAESDDADALDSLKDSATLHIRVVASARTGTARWPAPPSERMLRLREWTVRACRRLADRLAQGSVAALLLDPVAGSAVHPHLTLITGFLRGLAHHVRCPVVTVVTDAAPDVGLDQLAVECAAQRDRTVVLYRRGLRYVEQVCAAPVPAARTGRTPLVGDDAVVVATVGGRGITSEAVTALAEQARVKVWLLGPTPMAATSLGGIPDTLPNLPQSEVNAARTQFITAERAKDRQARVADLNRRFDELLRMRETAATLRRLRELCGADRVHYLVCDVTNAEQTSRAARTISDRDGRVDLLLHSAGRPGSTTVDTTTPTHARTVGDPRIVGYHNLKAAFADPAPRRWCNVTDDAAADEYLAAAARYARLTGSDEFTLAWGLSAPRGTDNAAAVASLLDELRAPRLPDPVVLVGADVEQSPHPPGTADGADTGSAATPTPPLLGEPDHQERDTAVWSWRPDPRRDGYLREHLVEGRPVLPSLIMVAMAAEAAARLVPDQTVTGFRDVRIEEACYADPDSAVPTCCRIKAHRHSPQRVRVVVSSDVVAPGGRVLRRDRVHCVTDVLLGEPPDPVTWHGNAGPFATGLTQDAYTRPDGTVVRLSGVWDTLSGITVDDKGAHARWFPRFGATDAVFETLRIPALLLDSLGRVMVRNSPEVVLTAVPTGVDRIDLFWAGSDGELARRNPLGVDLYYDAGQDQLCAVGSDGELLVRTGGMKLHVMQRLPVAVDHPVWRPDTPPADGDGG
jgi:3-oxoacyl-(acyl-carrier-protein) synthase